MPKQALCLAGTGLVCSPAKSEVLILPSHGRRPCASAADSITLPTQDDTAISHVQTLRVLALHLDSHRRNGLTVTKLATKTTAAIRLRRRISTRHSGMKEASLLRLVQSFVLNHVAYVAAFHNWHVSERPKVDALLRKAYKAALGLYLHTSTVKRLELGLHNTLDETAEAQRTAQLERLSQTLTGRHILQRLGICPRQQPPSTSTSLPPDLLQQLHVHPTPL